MLRIESVFAIHSWKKNNDFANVILTKLVRKGYWKLSILGCHFIKNHWRLIIDPRRGGALQPVSAPVYVCIYISMHELQLIFLFY